MANKVSQFFTELNDKIKAALAEQPWAQELKQKWEELDPQSKLYLKSAISIGSLVITLVLVVSSMLNVRSLKQDLAEKSDLNLLIQSANDELKRLRELNASQGAGDGSLDQTPLKAYIEAQAQAAGIDTGTLTVSDEKTLSDKDATQESVAEIQFKKITLRQAVKFVFGLENGARPIKVRDLKLDMQPDHKGYMDAVVKISSFTIKAEG